MYLRQIKYINLNSSKAGVIIFQPKYKQITKDFNFRISDKKINTYRNVEYLAVTLEENFDWNLHLSSIKLKLNKATDLLCKIRYPSFSAKLHHFPLPSKIFMLNLGKKF